MESEEKKTNMVSVLLFGAPGVGKSTIINRFLERPTPTVYTPTVGLESATATIGIKGVSSELSILACNSVDSLREHVGRLKSVSAIGLVATKDANTIEFCRKSFCELRKCTSYSARVVLYVCDDSGPTNFALPRPSIMGVDFCMRLGPSTNPRLAFKQLLSGLKASPPEEPAEFRKFCAGVFGAEGVGKTSIIQRFAQDALSPPSLLANRRIVAHFAARVNEVILDVELQVIDEPSFFGDQQMVEYIVYDVTSPITLQKASFMLYSKKEDSSSVMVLVGNKADLVAKRKVTYAEGYAVAQQYGVDLFFEVSAATGSGVEDMVRESVIHALFILQK